MKIRVLIGAWLLAVASAPVHPLGLGEILVNSRLNQPLDAEILVRENAPGEAEQLVAKLAAQEDYARVGLERARLPVLVRFETGTNARGQTVIRVRSDEPVREPFLTLLVEANWSGGRLLREYGVLLDPPVAAPASRITRTAPPAAAPATTQPLADTPPPAPAPAVEPAPVAAPPPAPTPAPVAAAPTPAPAPAAPAPTPRTAPPPGFAAPPPALPAAAASPAPAATSPEPRLADGSYTVQRGDTLTGIASQFAADAGVGLNQMMVALQRENPRAFFADNINALKAGAVLRVPDAANAALSRAEAAAEVRRQNESWTSARAPALADAGAAPARSSAAAPSASADPRLELLPPAADAPGSEAAGRAGTEQGGAQMAETQAELQRAREDLRSRDQEMTELMSRVRDLEELNAKNARLIELKDTEVAELQRRLAEASSAAAAAPAAVAEPEPAPAPEPAIAAAEPAPAAGDTEAGADAMAEAGDDAMSADDAITAADAEAGAAADPLGADAIDPLLAEAADATDPALAGDGASEDDWAASATDSQADPFAETDGSATAAASGEPTPVPVPAEPAPAPAGVADATSTTSSTAPAATPWYLQPMVQGAALIGLALILLLALLARRQRRSAVVEDTPRRSVAELFNTAPGAPAAGAVLAGDGEGDEALALQARIQADPDDLGAYLELLSLYYAEGDRDRFQHWAERMFEQPGAEESEEWDQVFGMGEELLPEHPLFAEDGEDETDQDLDDGFERYQEPTPAPVVEAPPPPRVVDIGGTDLRFESELDDVQDQEDDMPIEFERTAYDEPVSRPPVSAPAAIEDDQDTADALPALVFGDDDDVAAPAPVAAAPAQTGGDDGGLDDAATKLELARAYLDMGDPDGARAMLEEVLGEGDTSQREEARKLLATL